MSELVVGALRGLSSNSFEIDIATGSTLDLTNAKAGSIPRAALPTGSILQVVQTVKTDTFSMASSTFTDITGLTATITPISTTSKILVSASVTFSGNDTDGDSALFRLNGGNSSNYVGDAAGSRTRALAVAVRIGSFAVSYMSIPIFLNYLDSPATTSPVTYAVQTRRGNAGTVWVNKMAGTDNDNAIAGRTASSITLMEVAG